MRTRGVVLLVLAACSAPRPRTGTGDTLLAVQGRVVGGAARFGAADLEQLPRRSFRARDPRAAADARYEGIALARLLGDELEVERGADVAIVQGAGGYEVAIPLAVLRQHRPVLATRIDGEPVARARPAAAPLLLAWPTEESPGLQWDPRARGWWVDGVKRIDVRAWLGTYGRALRVPPGASDEARPGAEAFQTSCMTCHRLRGSGGTRGPELTDRLANAEERERFGEAIRAHASRPEAAAAAELPAATLRHIAAFLRAVAVAGPGLPQDEPPPEPVAPPRPPGMGPSRPPGT